jgi:hypothetical protein
MRWTCASCYRQVAQGDHRAVRRFAAWLFPGLAVAACVSLGAGAFVFGWRNPELTEMQVLQRAGEWWSSCWPLAVGLVAIYAARSWRELVGL